MARIPMLTQTYYLKRIAKSKDFSEWVLNTLRYVSFMQMRTSQSFKFGDPLLVAKSL